MLMTYEREPVEHLDGILSSRVCVEIGQNLNNFYRTAIQSI